MVPASNFVSGEMSCRSLPLGICPLVSQWISFMDIRGTFQMTGSSCVSRYIISYAASLRAEAQFSIALSGFPEFKPC